MSEHAYTRRGVLRAGAGATAAVAAGAAAGTAAAQSGFGGWLSDTGNYDGTVVDRTGQDEVTVAVGAEGNGGNFAFEPVAVRVDPGTAVRWEWTGEGGQHNVVEQNGAFESELTDESGFTYERTLDSEGVVKYLCEPHASLGMKGAVVVGDVDVGGGTATGGDDGGSDGRGGDGSDSSEGGGGGDGGGGGGGGAGTGGTKNAANRTALVTLLAMVALGFLSPVVFALLLRRRQKQGRGRWR